MHYRRWYLYGDPSYTKPRPTLRERLEAKIRRTGTCWLWTGSHNHLGYGSIVPVHPGVAVHAHRVVYEEFVGPIPAGLTIDHLCHNADLTCRGGPSCPHRLCVNPAHLEAVPLGVNISRAKKGRIRATHCPHGHPYDGFNPATGRRWCRTCGRLANARRRHRV